MPSNKSSKILFFVLVGGWTVLIAFMVVGKSKAPPQTEVAQKKEMVETTNNIVNEQLDNIEEVLVAAHADLGQYDDRMLQIKDRMKKLKPGQQDKYDELKRAYYETMAEREQAAAKVEQINAAYEAVKMKQEMFRRQTGAGQGGSPAIPGLSPSAKTNTGASPPAGLSQIFGQQR